MKVAVFYALLLGYEMTYEQIKMAKLEFRPPTFTLELLRANSMKSSLEKYFLKGAL